jgi:hypothetical protein
MLHTLILALGLPALALGAVAPVHQQRRVDGEAPLFTRGDIFIPEAAAENQLQLAPHPKPNVLASPVRARKAAMKAGAQRRAGTGSETVNTLFDGVYPTVNLTWGNKVTTTPGQQFISFIDTGSADTWVISSDLECVDISTKKPQTQAACGFGPLYDSTKGSFTAIANDKFSISYFPEGEELQGTMGTAPITMGGLTVSTTVALVDYAAWEGDGYSSGLLGLAYPAVTSATKQYNPIFTTMVKNGVVTTGIFTLAINRVPIGTSPLADAGLMALGGLVPATYYNTPFTSVAIQKEGSTLAFYTVSTSLVYRANTTLTGEVVELATSGSFLTIVDSGTAPNFVPTAAAKAINAAFSPPAVYNSTLGYYTTDCDAIPPYVAYVIGGVEMPMDPQDMIVRSLNGLLGYEDVCFSAFADGGVNTGGDDFIIGAVWQRAYVVAYDQARTMMHFAARKPY